VETKLQEEQVVCVQSVRGGFVAPAADQDERPEVIYRPLEEIVVGLRALIVPVNHYNTLLVDNGYPATTGIVIAYDEKTGYFETMRTRYVLDSITH